MTISHRAYLWLTLTIAAAVIAAGWLYTSRMPLAFMESGFPVTLAKKDMLDRCDLGSVVAMGDSRVEAAFIPARMPVAMTNLGLGAVGPTEMYFIARRLLACPNRPRLVVLAYAASDFQGSGEGLWKRAVRSGLMNYADLRELSAEASHLGDRSVETVDTKDGLTGQLRDLAYGFGFPSVFFSSLVDARINGRLASNTALYDGTLRRRGHVIYSAPSGERMLGVDSKLTAFETVPLQQYYLAETIRMFSAAGVPTRFVIMPLSQATVAAMHPSVADAYQRFIQSQAGASALSTGGGRIEGWPDNLFADGSHMTEAGAEAFSARVAPCIARWLTGDRLACDLHWTGE